jgi:integrase
VSYHLRRYKNSQYWYARITCSDGSRGNWKSTRKERKRDAVTVAEQWDAAATTGHRVVTLEKAFQLLAEHMRRKGGSKSTMEVLELKASHVASAFGAQRDIATLSVRDTEAYLDHRRGQGRKDATIAKELGYLSAALRRCHRLDMYSGNFEALWPDALAKVFKGKQRWITWHEYLRLLDEIAPQWKDHLIVYVSTGCRFSELYTLRSSDVRAGTLTVRGTKTDGAERKVPLSVEAAEALQRRVSESTDGVLFRLTSPDLASQKRAWLRALGSACRRLKMPHASTNDLRRTFASWCWHRSVDKDAVRRWMGHSSSKMLEEVYAQPSADHFRDEIAKFPTRHLTPISPQNLPTTQNLPN